MRRFALAATLLISGISSAWAVNSYSPWQNKDEVAACREKGNCVYPIPGSAGEMGYCARIDPQDGWRHKIWRLLKTPATAATCVAGEWPR